MTAGAQLPRVLYIAGYGRSGSTMLDLVFGNHPLIASGGEVANLARLAGIPASERGPDERSFLSTEPWAFIVERLQQETGVSWRELAKAQARLEPLVRGGVRRCTPNGPTATLRSAYSAATRWILGVLAEQAGARVVVDSSKTTRKTFWRPRALHEVCGLDVVIVWLVRDPRGVAAATSRGTNRQLAAGTAGFSSLRGFRGLLAWTMVNGATALAYGSGPRFDYDASTAGHSGSLREIGDRLGLDLGVLAGLLDGSRDVASTPIVAGNRFAHRGGVGRVVRRPPQEEVLPPPLSNAARALVGLKSRWLRSRT